MSHNRNLESPYSPQFRQQMVELVAAGRKPSELAKEFGCHETRGYRVRSFVIIFAQL